MVTSIWRSRVLLIAAVSISFRKCWKIYYWQLDRNPAVLALRSSQQVAMASLVSTVKQVHGYSKINQIVTEKVLWTLMQTLSIVSQPAVMTKVATIAYRPHAKRDVIYSNRLVYIFRTVATTSAQWLLLLLLLLAVLWTSQYSQRLNQDKCNHRRVAWR